MNTNLTNSPRGDCRHDVWDQALPNFSIPSLSGGHVLNIDNNKSPHSPSTSGVPQGTVMGPDGVLRRRRKRVRHAKNPMGEPERYCQVCGDKAINFNYGVISCESCKAFFRRNTARLSELVCVRSEVQAGTLCTIDKQSRKNCSACRLHKCFTFGMRREWEEVPPLQASPKKEESIRVNSPAVVREKATVTYQPEGHNNLPRNPTPVQLTGTKRETPTVAKLIEKELPLRILHAIDIENLQPMTGDHLTHITKLTFAFDELWIKTKFPDVILSLHNLESAKDVFVMVECIVRMTIACLRRVPEFSALTMDDKKRVLGVRLFPILAINCLMKMDVETGLIIFVTESGGSFYFDAEHMLSKNILPPEHAETMNILQGHGTYLKTCRDIIGLSKSLAAIIVIMKVLEPEPMTLFACSDSNEYDMESMSRRKYAYQFYATFFARYLRHIYPTDYAERWQRFLVWYDYSVQKFDHHAMILCQMITSAGVSDADLPVVLDICSYVRSGMANSEGEKVKK